MEGLLLLGKRFEKEFGEEGFDASGIVVMRDFKELAYEVRFVIIFLSLLCFYFFRLRDIRRILKSCPF